VDGDEVGIVAPVLQTLLDRLVEHGLVAFGEPGVYRCC
jgi:hypothetical protein